MIILWLKNIFSTEPQLETSKQQQIWDNTRIISQSTTVTYNYRRNTDWSVVMSLSRFWEDEILITPQFPACLPFFSLVLWEKEFLWDLVAERCALCCSRSHTEASCFHTGSSCHDETVQLWHVQGSNKRLGADTAVWCGWVEVSD